MNKWLPYSSFQSAFLFATNAAIPSILSAVAKVDINSLRSKKTPSSKDVSNAFCTASFASIVIGCDIDAI